jgi:hypothetical protein
MSSYNLELSHDSICSDAQSQRDKREAGGCFRPALSTKSLRRIENDSLTEQKIAFNMLDAGSQMRFNSDSKVIQLRSAADQISID